jgi:hypothetical protein
MPPDFCSGSTREKNRFVLTRLVACALAIGLWGAADAYAVTPQQVAKLVGDCTHHCGGPRGVGEVRPSAFGSGVAVSADGSTAMIGATGAGGGDGAVWVFARRHGSWRQQGPRLIVDCVHRCGGPNGRGETGNQFELGAAIALSATGNTALIGAPGNGERGGAWVFIRSHGAWKQQGAVLIGFCHPTTRTCTGPNGTGLGGFGFGSSVALSADGNSALIGAPGGVGGVWVFTRSHGSWSQQAKLVGNCRPTPATSCRGANGTGEAYSGVNTGAFGSGVALSSDGNTALIGAFGDALRAGAAWVFTRSGNVWSQQGAKLVGDCTAACSGPNGTGASPGADTDLGSSVALSADGNTALLGAPSDGNRAGAAWVFSRSGEIWSQQGAKLVADCTGVCGGSNGTGEVNRSDNGGYFGESVALTADGNAALIGAPDDVGCRCGLAFGAGAAWLFTRSGNEWSQAGQKLVGDCTSGCSGAQGAGERNGRLAGQFGAAVALGGTPSLALIGASNDDCHGHCDGTAGTPAEGAAWIFALPGL